MNPKAVMAVVAGLLLASPAMADMPAAPVVAKAQSAAAPVVLSVDGMIVSTSAAQAPQQSFVLKRADNQKQELILLVKNGTTVWQSKAQTDFAHLKPGQKVRVREVGQNGRLLAKSVEVIG